MITNRLQLDLLARMIVHADLHHPIGSLVRDMFSCHPSQIRTTYLIQLETFTMLFSLANVMIFFFLNDLELTGTVVECFNSDIFLGFGRFY